MDNKDFGKEMEKRTKELALRIIRLSSTLPSTPEGYVIRNQLTKSGTSVGANLVGSGHSDHPLPTERLVPTR